MLRSHLCSISIWLFQINLNLGFFSLPGMMQTKKKKEKVCHCTATTNIIRCIIGSRLSSHTDHTKRLLWFWGWVCFFKLFHKPAAEILTGRVIGQHRAGNKNEFRKGSTLLTSYLDLPFGLGKREPQSYQGPGSPPIQSTPVQCNVGQEIWEPPFSHLCNGGNNSYLIRYKNQMSSDCTKSC